MEGKYFASNQIVSIKQVADEIMADILKYLVSSDVADDA